MAKHQKRSNREARKPKREPAKTPITAPSPVALIQQRKSEPARGKGNTR